MPAGLVVRAIGGPPVVVTLAGDNLPLSAVGPLTIHHGRTDPDARPDASTLSFALDANALDELPELGDLVAVELSWQAHAALGTTPAAGARFRGRITDLDLVPAARHGVSTLSVVAVGPRADLGRVKVGDEPWPAELDGNRALRILALAQQASPALVAPIIGVDHGQVTVLGRDVDAQYALSLLDELATDGGGELVESRAGQLSWQDSEHRRNVGVALDLDADDILAPAKWNRSLSGIVNDLSLTHGDNATTRVVDQVEVDRRGRLQASVSTRIQSAADALGRALELVGRRSRPYWSMPTLTLDILRHATHGPAGLERTKAARALALEFGDLIRVTGMASIGPYTSARVYVEGWTETLDADSWQLQLAVSDTALTGPIARWLDVPDDVTWATFPALSWLGATGYQPPDVDAGRWADVPADVDWTETSHTWQDITTGAHT